MFDLIQGGFIRSLITHTIAVPRLHMERGPERRRLLLQENLSRVDSANFSNSIAITANNSLLRDKYFI